jgi:general secretion pathway protein G
MKQVVFAERVERLLASFGSAPVVALCWRHFQRRQPVGNKLKVRVLGVTLIELMMVVLLIGLLVGIALPSYRAYLERTKIVTAKADILEISARLDRAFVATGTYPASLAAFGAVKADPWGNPYQYLSMDGAKVGQKRKDKSLHPLNSDYDLYSMGPDGQSQTPLTAKTSRDDIIRANNGGFIGVAEDY